VDVPIEDRDPADAQLFLRVARRHDDVVEEAEAHRPVGERMVTGRANEREPAAVDGVERDARRERRRLPRGLRGDRVRIELDGPFDRLQLREVLGNVSAEQLLLGRAARDRCSVESREALLPLRVRSSGVQSGERGVRQRVDAASSRRVARPSNPSSRAAAAPAPQSGTRSATSGNGALGSNVATRR